MILVLVTREMEREKGILHFCRVWPHWPVQRLTGSRSTALYKPEGITIKVNDSFRYSRFCPSFLNEFIYISIN